MFNGIVVAARRGLATTVLIGAALCAALLMPGSAVLAAPAQASLQPLGVYRSQVVVTPRPATTGAQLDAVLTLQGLKKLSVSQVTRDVLVQVPLGVDPIVEALTLSGQPLIQRAVPNWAAQAAATPNDTYYAKQYALSKIDAPGAWSQSTGAGVTVAVVDTGVQASHPDLGGRVLAGWDFINDDSIAEDDYGHGTHVAGIIAATANNGLGVAGVAPSANILPVKVLDANGSGGWFQLAEGVYYATARGARVINMSIQGTSYDDSLAAATAYARAHGVVEVACAGNYSTDIRFYPGSLPGVIAVSATDSRDQLASFSNFGSWVDMSAPGVDVLSTTRDGAYGYMSGTSMAAPAVAGAAAVVLAKYPALSAEQVENALEGGATDIGDAGKDPLYGSGRLSISGALSAAASATTSGSGSITGKVTGAALGLGSAQVTAYRVTGGIFEPTVSTISAPDGTYLLANLRSGPYVVGVRDSLATWAPAYYSLTGPVVEQSAASAITVTNALTTVGINVDLVKAGSVGGTVHRTGGAAVGGARVELGYTSGLGDFKAVAATQTLSNGTYRFSGLATGSYYLRSLDPTGTMLPAYYSDLDGPAAAQVATGVATNSVDMTMTPGGVVTGRVLSTGGAALRGMLVNVEAETIADDGTIGEPVAFRAVTTDASGTYVAAGLDGGQYTVTVSDPSGSYETSAAPGQVSVSEGATATLSDIRVRAAGHVRGRIVDASGTPLPGIEVSGWIESQSGWMQAGVATFTAGDGSYDFGGLGSGTVELDYSDLTGKYSIPYNSVLATAGATLSGVNATGTTAPKISGRVVDADGHPVAGIRVRLGRVQDARAFTAADGTYSFYAWFPPGPGEYSSLEFSDPANRYFTQYDPGTFEERNAAVWGPWGDNDRAGVDATLTAAAKVVGTVRDGAGNPRADIEVSIGGQNALTDSSGRYTVGGVDYGQYSARFFDASGSLDATQAPLDISDSTTPTSLDVTMTGAGSISGTVLDPLGKPRPLSAVYCGTAPGDFSTLSAQAITDEHGHYRFAGVPAGDVYVWYIDAAGLYADQYWPAGSDPVSALPVTVGSGAAVAHIDFALVSLGGVSGKVTDASSTALADATVQAERTDPDTGETLTAFAQTDATGAYRLRVTDGAWVVSAYDEKHSQRYYSGAATYAAATPVTVTKPTVTTGINFSLPAQASISGTVTASVGGAPIAGATVTGYLTSDRNQGVGSAVTKADGSYTMYVDGPGQFKVLVDGASSGYDQRYYASATAWASATVVSVASQGQKKSAVSVALPQLSTISGKVILPGGASIADLSGSVWVDLLDPATGMPFDEQMAADDGSYSFRVSSGSYKLQAYTDYDSYLARYYPASPTLAGGTTVTIAAPVNRTGTDITLGEPASIEGTVSASGYAVGGVAVTLLATDGSTVAAASSNGDGSYFFGGLESGTYSVAFSDDAGRFDTQYYAGASTQASATPIVLGVGDSRSGVSASMTSAAAQVISGKVVDGLAKPIAGVTVSTADPYIDGPGYSSLTKADGTFRIVCDSSVTATNLYLYDPVSDASFQAPDIYAVPSTGSGVTIVWDQGTVIDVTPPVTQASTTPVGWTKGPVEVSLTASDAGSGVESTLYSVNGRPAHDYAEPLSFSVEGTTAVSYYSYDYAGNYEAPKSVRLRIDRTPPSTVASPSATYPAVAGQKIQLTSSDALSGVSATYWRVDTGAWTAGTQASVPTALGAHTLQYYSVDVAGNAEGTASAAFIVVPPADTTPPVTAATPSPANAFAAWSGSDVTISLTATDPLSGIAWTRYQIGGGAELTYTVPVVISAPGTSTFSYRSQDGSGNVEATKTATVRIDKVAPSISLDATGSYQTSAIISAQASDVLSGVDYTEVRFDADPLWTRGYVASTSIPGVHTVWARTFDLAGNTAETSATFTVIAAPVVPVTLPTTTRLTAPSSVKVKKVLKLSGTVVPARSGVVSILMQRKVGKKWKTAGTARVAVSAGGTYLYSFKPKYRGSWRFVATYGGGVSGSTTYLGSKSTTRSVKVK